MIDSVSGSSGWGSVATGQQAASWNTAATSGTLAGNTVSAALDPFGAGHSSMPMDKQTMGAMVVTSTLDRFNGPVLAGQGNSAAMAEDYNFNKSVLEPWTGKGTVLDTLA